jgi:uncharacterized protein YidB (DUF937 family)
MGFLDTLLRNAIGNTQEGTSGNPMLDAVLGMINNSQSGGLAGLLQAFHDKGFGEIARSWVSTGENLPISTSDLAQVLGSRQIAELAQRFGLSSDVAASQLSVLLPHVVDQLTPDGRLPDAGSLSGTLDNFKTLG